jgi:glycosyltransferase involved in cell wall biosynthesis
MPPTAVRTILHLTASRCYGGPERQMLGLAQSLRDDYRVAFASFAEGGLCRPFLAEVENAGFPAVALGHDTPQFVAAVNEIAALLRRLDVAVLCCHGYKANLLGRPAARRAGVPAVAVSRGWTGEGLRVRLYEALDRLALRWMDHVVCVSEGQAEKVRAAGVPAHKVTVIHNAIRPDRFAAPDRQARDTLAHLFPEPPSRVVAAVGRLSPEKGFGVLVDAAAAVARAEPSVGFVLFGDGPQRAMLTRRVAERALEGRFVLPGFRPDLDRYFPAFDLLVAPSFTEGLSNVLLEAFAAGVPVVATAVGGNPEVVEDAVNGYLVPAGDPGALARRILDALACEQKRQELASRGRERIRERFTFDVQTARYRRFFESLNGAPARN